MNNIKHEHDSARRHEDEAQHNHESTQNDYLENPHKSPDDHENDSGEREQIREKAQNEALEIASTVNEVRHPHHEASPAEKRHSPITKRQLNHEFQETMTHVQAEMPRTQRTFSKFIHNQGIEKASDFLGATIARPNALLAGAIGAFTLTLFIYLFAKNIGYQLSGFEPIAAFILGWIVGSLYDYFRIMVTGKR